MSSHTQFCIIRTFSTNSEQFRRRKSKRKSKRKRKHKMKHRNKRNWNKRCSSYKCLIISPKQDKIQRSLMKCTWNTSIAWTKMQAVINQTLLRPAWYRRGHILSKVQQLVHTVYHKINHSSTRTETKITIKTLTEKAWSKDINLDKVKWTWLIFLHASFQNLKSIW